MMAKFCCQNCKYWEVPLDLLVTLRDDSFRCCTKGESQNGHAMAEGTLMYAVDSECYFASVVTSPLFLCSMFKGKGDSDA